MLIFKSKEKVPVFPNDKSFIANGFEVVSFNMSILTDESKNVASDFYVIPQNKNIEINFQFGDLGIEAHFFYDNDTQATFVLALTLEDIKQIAKKEYKLDIDNIATYSNFVNSSWRDHVMTSFKEFIYNKIAAA